MYSGMIILGVVKRNPLFFHSIEWKNNGFLFTTPNISALFGRGRDRNSHRIIQLWILFSPRSNTE